MKFCGYNESCFESNGETHVMSGIICKHRFCFNGDDILCDKTNKIVVTYSSQKQYEELLEIEANNSLNPIDKLMHKMGYQIQTNEKY